MPSEQKRLILVSSDQITRSQSVSVQSLWSFANCNLFLIFLAERSGFLSFFLALSPASLRARRTVLAFTDTLSSSFNLFVAAVAVGMRPDVTDRTQCLLS